MKNRAGLASSWLAMGWLAACGMRSEHGSGTGPDAETDAAVSIPADPRVGALVDAAAGADAGPATLRVAAGAALTVTSGTGGIAFDVFGPGCFQVDSLANGSTAFIGTAESGAYCIQCAERASAALSGARFVFPSNDSPIPAGPLQLRIGPRDCDTLTPVDAATTFSVRPLALPSPPERGVVTLDVSITAGSIHAGESLPWLAGALDAQLADIGIQTDVTVTTANGPADAEFSRSDLDALVALTPPPSGAIRVVLAGCLQLRDPVSNALTEVQGFTPHIPGGAGLADAIFIQGAECGSVAPDGGLQKTAWPDDTLAKLIAHELGHYLGLYHAVEADGSTDQLADTDANNVMNWRPTLATAHGLTPMQGRVMRRHPAVTSAH